MLIFRKIFKKRERKKIEKDKSWFLNKSAFFLMGGKMNTETNTIAIPRKVFREIRWHLKHFNDLDDYIKTRENQIIPL